MKIPEDQVAEAVKIWGYTPREARFLWLVTAFGGHFIREQYRLYCDLDRGKTDQTLSDKLLHLAHVTGGWKWGRKRQTFRYHVHARPLYRVFGRENSSHRKPTASNATIAIRVATLDFVLGELEPDYLLTDQDRLGYLKASHGITDASLIPSRTYPARGSKGTTPAVTVPFPDRFPMSVLNGTVTFSFVDAPDDGLQPFETHLVRYAPLIQALKTPARFVFISGIEAKIARAEGAFRAALATPQQQLTPELLRYFTLEDHFVRKDFTGLRKRDYDERLDLAKQFGGSEYRKLFDRWRSGTITPESSTNPQAQPPSFSTFHARSLDA
jgi:hypothetical protein